jgi:hypothetical protein
MIRDGRMPTPEEAEHQLRERQALHTLSARDSSEILDEASLVLCPPEKS